MILLYSSFLLKSHNILDGDIEIIITLEGYLLKNNLRSFKIVIDYCW